MRWYTSAINHEHAPNPKMALTNGGIFPDFSFPLNTFVVMRGSYAPTQITGEVNGVLKSTQVVQAQLRDINI